MAIYEIRDLNFAYPEQPQKAIDGLSLSVQKGEFLLLCGQSGCGKSTLLRQLKTALAVHGERQGVILFEGQPLEQVDLRTQAQKIGFVQQSPDNQIVTDKVWHELAFGLESLGYPTSVIRGRVSEMAAFFGIDDWFYKNVTELSGGQKQLLNLASVMVMQPSVLILDEPTSQLDPIAAADFLATLAKINRELGTTVILTEHRLEEAFPLADHVVVLEQGHKLCEGGPRQIGSQLKQCANGMFWAMPTPVQVWMEAQQYGECPLTVAEGRRWLEEYGKAHALHPCENKTPLVQHSRKAIQTRELWFRYEKEGRDIIKGLAMQVYTGELFALMGGNGAGKTTTLKVLAGQEKPYRGEWSVDGTVALLPQNPQAIFVKKTVREDLWDIFRGSTFTKEQQAERIAYVVALCQIGALLDRHPFDLSGGEQQRAAFAKLLLTSPDILLLDEPTKGLDAEFKRSLAAILHALLRQGKTILMVSHDVEFCARYADRCALFFDGNITTENTPRAFFAGNNFYTTAANRMSRGLVDNAIIAEDIILACGGSIPPEPELLQEFPPLPAAPEEKMEAAFPQLPLWRKIIAGIFGAAAIGILIYATKLSDITKLVSPQGMTQQGEKTLWLYVAMLIALFGVALALYRKERPAGPVQTTRENRKLTKRTLASIGMVLVMIPFTLYIGLFYFGYKQYYALSFVILLECMLPFFMIFEGRHPQARELMIIAVLCALGVAGRAALFMLPQFKPVAALTILAGVAFGGESGFLVGAMTMLVSNILFQQGPWTPWQMFAMGLIGFFAGVLFKKGWLRRTRISLCIYGALAVLAIYGGIMNPVSALLWGNETLNSKILLTYYLTGFPMDCVHAAGTVFVLWFGTKPMLEKLERVKSKYGILS